MLHKIIFLFVVSFFFSIILSCSTIDIDNKLLQSCPSDLITIQRIPYDCYIYDKTTTNSLHKLRSYYLFANDSLNKFIDKNILKYEIFISNSKLNFSIKSTPLLFISIVEMVDKYAFNTSNDIRNFLKDNIYYNKIHYDSLVNFESSILNYRFSGFTYGFELDNKRILQETYFLKHNNYLIIIVTSSIYANERKYLGSIFSSIKLNIE